MKTAPSRLMPVLGALALLATAAVPCAADGEAFPGIEKLMSEEEYRAAGLDKLDADERDALNRWLVEYTVGEAGILLQGNEAIRKAERKLVIEAKVSPPFTGWNGDTVFRLDNGQVWKQRIDGRFTYDGDSRSVLIDKNLLGFWRITHISTGKRVGVTRIR